MQPEKFLKTFEPGQTVIPPAETIALYEKILPAPLIALWREKGWGKYGGGLIELVDPSAFQDTLERWLGRKAPNYVPIAIGAFGQLFYYRKLTENDEDVCMLDPHYRSIINCSWSLSGFFDNYLCDEEVRHDILDEKLFSAAIMKHGPLSTNEIFFFSPALALGGAKEEKYIDKGNCQVHLEILFQLA